MKKIGTITFHNSINYGAILQTYALQKCLTDLGYDSEVIDYRNSYLIKNMSLCRRIVHYAWHEIFKRILAGETRRKKTIKFLNKHIRISKNTYHNASQLHETPPIYDVYITGSDQVWNPNITGADCSYFLTFAPAEKLRISYAPSFGLPILKDNYMNLYKEWLKSIDKLSVREDEGKEIIKEIADREATVTLDPTLLLKKHQWEEISTPYEGNLYVLCYYMLGDKKVNKAISKIAKIIANYNNWDIISIGQKEYMKLVPGYKKIFDAGPDQFVGLFQNASYVITNSFHGTVFSIIFNKPFYVPVNDKLPPEKNLSSRIASLLQKLELEDRLIPVDKSFGMQDMQNIEYDKVNKLLRIERDKSLQFLKKALEEQ